MSVNTYLNGSLVNAATTSHIQTGSADQASVLPEASSTLLNRIIQYTGTTTSDYTNGYFYKCVQISDDPVTYGWIVTQIKPAQTAAETPYESSNVQDTIDALLASIGYSNDHVIGLEADFENSTFRRLGGAKNKSAGNDFNVFNMYGERKLCNLADDGTITAWYGDANYTETGYTTIVDPDTQEETTIQVQVMVRQPKFYYKVVPIKLEPITDGDGYSGVKMHYYISDKPLPGFKLHPAFINANGDEVDCYYIGAYEACIYDASETKYLDFDSWDVSYDEQTDTYIINQYDAYTANTSNDKLASISGIMPATGEYSSLTRPAVRTLSRNRGTGWEPLNIKILSAEQLLFAIEYSSFNVQSCIGLGAISRSITGSTSSIGNSSGMAQKTYRLDKTTSKMIEYTNKNLSIKYRGVENMSGNINKYVDGITVYPSSALPMGSVRVCTNFNYAETSASNYKDIEFSLPSTGSASYSYIKYFGYSQTYDWIFLPSRTGGNSSLPVGDMVYTVDSHNAYRTVANGGSSDDSRFGIFFHNMNKLRTQSDVYTGARLCYV